MAMTRDTGARDLREQVAKRDRETQRERERAEREMEKEEKGSGGEGHVLVIPFPIQGHLNPMLQFSKRLAAKELRVTVITTSSTHKFMEIQATSILFFEPIYDGFPEGMKPVASKEYFVQFYTVVSQSLAKFIQEKLSSKYPPKFVVYDSVLPWALNVARGFGLGAASFFTQSCAVNAFYYHLRQEDWNIPLLQDSKASLPLLSLLRSSDLPSFVYDRGSHPALRDFLMNQFNNLHEANCILFSSFAELEPEVTNWMVSKWPIKNIGPTVPSSYLDKRLEDDKNYELSIFKPEAKVCLNWLDSKQPASVVYISFGSLAALGEEQMKELAWGLNMSGSCFLWVARESEVEKLPTGFREEMAEKGLIVKWSPQLEVLAHKSVGCFMSHCGWNSTLEALSLGVPMVAMPQWIDQPTNAKFVADVWQVGIQVKVNEEGLVTKEEISRCIRELMQGERRKQIKQNSNKWKQLAKQAVDKGGSSDKNIEEFVAKLACN